MSEATSGMSGDLGSDTQGSSDPRAAGSAPPSSRGVAFGPMWFLLAAVGGMVSGLTLDFTRGRFDKEPQTYANPTAEQTAVYNRQRQAALRWSVAASAGLAGALLAGFYGLSFGLARRSLGRSVVGVVLGGVSGAVLVGTGGMFSQYCYTVASTSGGPPLPIWTSLMQLTFWLPQALAIVAASAAALRAPEIVRVALASLAAALVSAVVVPILGVVLFVITFQNTRDYIPPDTLGHCLVMGLTGSITVAALVSAVFRQRRSVESTAARGRA